MPIIFARVDDRLIHGQVVQAWLPQLNADEVLISRPRSKAGSINEGLLRLSLPYEYDLCILDAPSAIRYAARSKRRIFLLLASLSDFADLVKEGLQLKSVNIGGMHFKENAQKVAEHVFLNEQDKRLLKLICDLGISVETRAVPTDVSLSVREVLP